MEIPDEDTDKDKGKERGTLPMTLSRAGYHDILRMLLGRGGREVRYARLSSCCVSCWTPWTYYRLLLGLLELVLVNCCP